MKNDYFFLVIIMIAEMCANFNITEVCEQVEFHAQQIWAITHIGDLPDLIHLEEISARAGVEISRTTFFILFGVLVAFFVVCLVCSCAKVVIKTGTVAVLLVVLAVAWNKLLDQFENI
jgi:Flp pilus assembly protein TadB